jgi:hypothetical protein
MRGWSWDYPGGSPREYPGRKYWWIEVWMMCSSVGALGCQRGGARVLVGLNQECCQVGGERGKADQDG